MWVIDTEADGLVEEATHLHCLVAKKYLTDSWMIFCNLGELPAGFREQLDKDHNIKWYPKVHINKFLRKSKTLACHNLYGYDLHLLKKLGYLKSFSFYPQSIDGKPVNLVDSLSISRALNPDRMLPMKCPSKVFNPVTKKFDTIGAHGLAAWGYRVSNQKPKVDDWRNQPLEVYVNRCFEDVKINELTIVELKKESCLAATSPDTPNIGLKGGWGVPLRINMKADFIMDQQEKDGILFDADAAEKLMVRIDEMMQAIAEEVEPQLPRREIPKSRRPNFPKEPFNQDGSISSTGYAWLARLGYEINEEEKSKDVIKFPAKPFKTDGTISATGLKWLEKVGFDMTRSEMDKIDYLQENNGIIVEPVVIAPELVQKAREDLINRVTPDMTEPMTLSNQDDIKKYLFEVEGWKPTIWRTKDVTRDENKRNRPQDVVLEKISEYVDSVMESPYIDFISEEMEVNFKKLPKEKIISKLEKQARYLVTSPKFKDEKGEMCPSLEFLKGAMAKKIITWLSLRNRRSVLKAFDETKETGWLNNPRLSVDGRLGQGHAGPTNTNRYKHRTIVNLPKASPDVLLGYEFRDLFIAPENKYILGYDGSNLEQFVAASYAYHYDGGDYAAKLGGDSHCYTGDVEILTKGGWKRFDNLLDEDLVAQYHEDGAIDFTETSEVVRQEYSGEILDFSGRNMDLSVTPNHRMVIRDVRKDGVSIALAHNYSTSNGSTRYITAGNYDGDLYLTPEEISLLVAIQADGSWAKTGYRIELAKERKKEKILGVLGVLGCEYKKNKGKTLPSGRKTLSIFIREEDLGRISEYLDDDKNFKNSLIHLTLDCKRIFIEELSFWDGWKFKNNIFYSQAEQRGKSVDVAASIASLSGLGVYLCDIHKEGAAKQVRLTTSSSYLKSNLAIEISGREYKGKIYCVTVPTGMVLVRRNGKVVVSGNTTNAEAYTLAAGRTVTRSEGKNITYAVLYGAQAKKVARMLGVSLKAAQAVIDAFWDTNFGLKALKEDLEAYWEATGKRYIRGIDGRKIYTRSKHSLVNALFQSCGSIIMFYSGCLMYDMLMERGLIDKGVTRLAFVHDEYQYEVPKELVEVYEFETEEEAKEYVDPQGRLLSNVAKKDGLFIRYYSVVGELGNKSLEEAGKFFNMPLPFNAAYDVGKSLAETH